MYVDPPIKQFAERHKYGGTDTIAVRDLGFVFSWQGQGSGSGSSQSNGSSSALAHTDMLQSSSSLPAANQLQATATAASKRAPSLSPDHWRRDRGYESS